MVLLRVRRALARQARMKPSAAEQAGAERRVYIVLMDAFGMGGTVRATHSLAGHLARVGYDVTILSVIRLDDEPFFEFPPGVRVEVLDDKRNRPSLLHPVARAMAGRRSVLMHPQDRSARNFSLLADWRLVRALRGKAGILITTRPGLNLISAQLSPPGLVKVGQEHMNLRDHAEPIQEAMRRHYRKLGVLSVLTRRDRRRYRQHLGERPRVVRAPNAVRDLGGVRADPSARTVIAAGRFVKQKGFDRLIRSWELTAPDHPGWRLRIYGDGKRRDRLQGMIDRRGLGDSITLAEPVADLGTEMAKASIFALSSRWEGLPMVLLEAMSAGMAVVSVDCPTGPADVVVDHVNGLLIRPRTVAALAAGLGEMMDDEELRRRCGAAAVETAREYSMEVIGPQWERVLERTWERGQAYRRAKSN
jgi:glycosyltransferase involved in cell wall biosynthesis